MQKGAQQANDFNVQQCLKYFVYKKNWIWGQLRVMQKELCDLDEHLDP